MPIRDLAAHPAQYVTIAELAEYWAVSRQQIYKRIESGGLEAIRLGLRLYRVRTRAALEYERRAAVTVAARENSNQPSKTDSTHWRDKLPPKIGLQRVRKGFDT
jgi:excisionase family DNA binding protein